MVIVRPRSSVRLAVLRAVPPLPELLLDDCDELLTEERDETEALLDTLLLAEDRPPLAEALECPEDPRASATRSSRWTVTLRDPSGAIRTTRHVPGVAADAAPESIIARRPVAPSARCMATSIRVTAAVRPLS
jgi:hypothetical protein